MVADWEQAYRAYQVASDAAARSRRADPEIAQQMAEASWSVARTWRDLAADHDQSWWVLAAVRSAVQAFEDQARSWQRRAGKNVVDLGEQDGSAGATFVPALQSRRQPGRTARNTRGRGGA